MTSNFVEIVPLVHRQGNGIPSAAIRWPDLGDRPCWGAIHPFFADADFSIHVTEYGIDKRTGGGSASVTNYTHPTSCYDASMSRSRRLAIIATAVVLSACASPSVDTSAPTFDETQYTVDLDNCRGGTVLDVALQGLESALIWSAMGAADGAFRGALSGNSPEGAAIGAAVGGVIGVLMGAYEPIQEQAQSVRECLSEKGYLVGS